MAQLSAKLRSIGGGQIGWFCPGCEQLHVVKVEGQSAWQWDGNVTAPTISPSVLCSTNYDENGRLPDGQTRTTCHCFVRGGNIEFCLDSRHALAGETVPLPDLPDWLRD